MKIGYVRVSTIEQNTARQEKFMEENGVEKIFSEKVSGRRRDNREALNEMLKFIREGDELYIESFTRLGRNTMELLMLVDEIAKRGVRLISGKEQVDTDTPTGKFMLTVFAALAELEVEQIALRRDEGIAIAKTEGKYKGRQPIVIEDDMLKGIHDRWYDGEITGVYAAKQLGVSRSTFYRKMWEYEDAHGLPRKGE